MAGFLSDNQFFIKYAYVSKNCKIQENMLILAHFFIQLFYSSA